MAADTVAALPARPASSTMTDRSGVGLVDSFRVKHPGELVVGTFNSFGKALPGPEKIDYIFVEPATRVIDAGIDRRSKDGRFPSDHFAVWAKIQVSAPK